MKTINQSGKITNIFTPTHNAFKGLIAISAWLYFNNELNILNAILAVIGAVFFGYTVGLGIIEIIRDIKE